MVEPMSAGIIRLPEREDFETLARFVLNAKTTNERMELLRQMCEIIRQVHLVLRFQAFNLWN